mmetsp:Transcript_68719/g.136133  ORF Transcript_68719/g.136133 Transcript_68719/m.136133 type:complete len:153 (-) Transcript_68719:42-500(-)
MALRERHLQPPWFPGGRAESGGEGTRTPGTLGPVSSPESMHPARLSQLEHVGVYPGPRSVVLIDNASIHKSRFFVEEVARRGGIVLFTPPYCWDLTPLDNGAFGKVKLWLEKNSELIDAMGWTTREALDAAFRRAIPNEESARECFHRCKYF